MIALSYEPIQTLSMPAKVKMAALVWRGVNATLYRYSPFFCRGWRRFLLRVFGATISATASPNRLAIIDHPWNLKMEEYASVGPNSWVYALDKISIGAKTCVGEGVKILTGTHSVSDMHFGLITAPISIGACCWIATSATLLPGLTIGDGAVVGACAVVTKDVGQWTVVAGNPAKVIKKRVLSEANSPKCGTRS